jgi:multidrug resistance efflux pump
VIDDLKDYHHSRDFFERRVPFVFTGFLVIVLAMVFGAMVWAALGEIDVVVKAPALLRPEQNISTLKNAVSGPLAVKNFVQGLQVHQGDLLWRVDTTSLEVDRANSSLQELRAAAKARTLTVYEQAVLTDANTVSPIESEAQARAAVYFSETSRLALTWKKALQAWERERDLPASMTTAQKVRDLETEAQLAKIALESYRAQERLRLQDEKAALVAEREALAKRRADLERQKIDAEVRAPLDGTVEELKKVNRGDYLLVGEEVARLVPAGAEHLKLELSVDNRDIAELHPGLPVTVRFTALAPSEFGQLQARLTTVPSDASGGGQQAVVFVVEASVDQPWLVNRKGERITLKSGMAAEARILLKRKPIWRFLLEKLDFFS